MKIEVIKVTGFEVLTPVVMVNYILQNITPCSPLKVSRRFGGTYRYACCLLHACLLLYSLFSSVDAVPNGLSLTLRHGTK
jgi:hypothetical protein